LRAGSALALVLALGLLAPGAARALSRPLPARAWALSVDVRPALHTTARIRVGSAVRRVTRLTHVEAVGSGGRLEIPANARAAHVLVTPRADRGLLLLHRLAELQYRIPPRGFLVGSDAANRLHLDPGFWTRGLFAGALWRASALGVDAGLFRTWALARTRANFGAESRPTHDLGFMYGESSLAAWQRAGWAARARCGRRASCAPSSPRTRGEGRCPPGPPRRRRGWRTRSSIRS
jgi:hypothetical protein